MSKPDYPNPVFTDPQIILKLTNQIRIVDGYSISWDGTHYTRKDGSAGILELDFSGDDILVARHLLQKAAAYV